MKAAAHDGLKLAENLEDLNLRRSDKKFYPASAKVTGEQVVVSFRRRPRGPTRGGALAGGRTILQQNLYNVRRLALAQAFRSRAKTDCAGFDAEALPAAATEEN